MIKIENLSFSYNDSKKQSLKNINLEINDGDFLGIIGASGAGKTTLTCALNGIIPHHYKGKYFGKVLVNNKDVFETDPCKLALDIGSIFQDIDSQITNSIVEDEILFGLENFGISKDEIQNRLEWALKETGIENLREREISSLSGGQKQKTAIAAIVALRPKILVLDEPTGELDPIASRNIFKLLNDLNQNYGITIIVVEQKIMLLSEFAKKLAIMKNGCIEICDSVREVLRDSEHLINSGINLPRTVSLYNELINRRLITHKKDICINIEEATKITEEIIGNE